MQEPTNAEPARSATSSLRRGAAIVTSTVFAWAVVALCEWALWDKAPVNAWSWLLGILGPIALLGVLAGGVAAWVLEPQVPWGLPRLWTRLADRPPGRIALSFAVGSWLGVASLLLLGGGALTLLSREGSASLGPVFGGCVLGCGIGVMLLSTWATRRPSGVIPPTLGIVLGSAAWFAFALLVFLGETSGGGGPTGMWGVLRREELDLTLPLYALCLFVVGYQMPLLVWRWPAWLAPCVVVCIGIAWKVSGAIPVGVALEAERQAPLTAVMLRTYQRWHDADGDGFAARFGGGDCDDSSPDVNPDAHDVAGNSIDEDCSGRDATVTPKETPPGGEPTAASLDTAAPTPPTAPAKDLNVVLITVDTLRFDLGYMGYERPISPNIDALAKKSTVYERSYSLASYTSKSMGPMLIGRYGSETNRGWMHFNKYPREDVMVQERLKAAGVFTMSVQGHWYFKEDTGLGRGFDVLDLSAAPTRPQGEGDKTVNSPQLSDAAIALLAKPERAAQRFFMWVHYLDPHAEYVRHAEFDFGSSGRARYDGEIAFTDHHVGRVLDAIAASPFADRTIVVVTSDHGEAFGEHGLIRHGFELWEELVRVPLVVYIPGQEPRRIQERRSAIDLVPTFLDIFGVPEPVGDDFLSGQSMLPEWYGEAPKPRDIFIDMPAGPYNGDRQAYISDDLKLTTSNSRPMGLYNLATDPGETKNLTKEAAMAEEALERMKEFRSKLRVVKVKPQ